ncbi:MAG: hypothetical protein FWC23_04680 [Chitinispirillia bacterium]|nr:hypothetical protein [Chitinispirillia bacterium]MCL2268463.1 hypothetical protein [Chitinispirillia bacterium]
MKNNYVPDWKLERYILGELPDDELEAIGAMERSDEALRGRIAALRESDAQALAKYPPEWMARKAETALAGRARAAGAPAAAVYGGMMRWAFPIFACVALLLLLPLGGILPTDSRVAQGDVYEDRPKGVIVSEPALEVWRKTGGDAEKLAPEAAVRAGDIVQLRYIVPGPCYGALISMDGRGVLTVHLSDDNGGAARLISGRPVALDDAYQLDDAPTYEAFYLITASNDFELESVKRTLLGVNHPIGDGRDLALPQKQVTAFTLRK